MSSDGVGTPETIA